MRIEFEGTLTKEEFFRTQYPKGMPYANAKILQFTLLSMVLFGAFALVIYGVTPESYLLSLCYGIPMFLIAISAVLQVLLIWFLPRMRWKRVEDHGLNTFAGEITESTIEIRDLNVTAKIECDQISNFVRSHDNVMVYYKFGNGTIFPRRFFKSDDEWTEFCNFLDGLTLPDQMLARRFRSTRYYATLPFLILVAIIAMAICQTLMVK